MAIKLSTAQRQKIRLILFLILLACYHNSIHMRSYLRRAALVIPDVSPRRKLYDKGDESLFLHITGLTRDAFNALLHTVIPPGHYICRRRRGRPWSLPPDGMLGLLMCYLGSQMSNKWLWLIFGITPSLCSRILRRMLRMTVKRLHSHPLARVEFPNEARIPLYLDMVSAREPTVTKVSLGLTTECTDERRTQNVYYCGYDCDTMVNNVLVFGPDGKVFFVRSTIQVVGPMEL